MCAGMPGCIEALELDRLADSNGFPVGEPTIQTRDAPACARMGEHPCPGRGAQRFVAADVVTMFVGVEDLGDRPATFAGGRCAELPIEGSTASASPDSLQAIR